eukprot:GHVU01007480.1.p1 GENE.GHVU01007480.1~~GHVU01007480.1.p1  ORF type:complete len:209 (+),score=13.45 GHVU01007480.1:108-734(+)
MCTGGCKGCGSRSSYCCGCSVAVGAIVTGVAWMLFAFIWITLWQDKWVLWVMSGYNCAVGFYGAVVGFTTKPAWLNLVAFILHALAGVANLGFGLYHIGYFVEKADSHLNYLAYNMTATGVDNRTEQYTDFLILVGFLCGFILMWVCYTACCWIPIDLHVALWRIRKAGGTGYDYKTYMECDVEHEQREMEEIIEAQLEGMEKEAPQG